jgi:hypothetical protein
MEWFEGLDREQVEAVIEFAARSLDVTPSSLRQSLVLFDRRRTPKKSQPRRRRLSSNTAVVVSMRADPIPDDDGTIENTQGAVAKSDANGIEVFRLFYFLEAKTRVTRISAEKPVGLPRLSLNFIWQGSKCGSEGARGARLNH